MRYKSSVKDIARILGFSSDDTKRLSAAIKYLKQFKRR